MSEEAPGSRRRIAYLTYSTGQFDSRTERMAESAVERGYDVVVYARWEPGVALESEGRGYRIVRVPALAELAIPGLRGRGRRRLRAILSAGRSADAASGAAPGRDAARQDRDAAPVSAASGPGSAPAPDSEPAGSTAPAQGRWVDHLPRSMRGTVFGWPLRRARIVSNDLGVWRRRLVLFPLRPMGWAVALADTADPADLWHGMWAASLPALDRLRRRHGGRTIYDSRDIYVHARGVETMGRGWKSLLGRLERRWARRADAILTVNDAYARILAGQLRVPIPPVVRNTPRRYVRPSPAPDLLRRRLDLPASTRIVLYQGGLMSDRGIEQGMEAILAVPDAVLVLMGFGSHETDIRRLAATPRYADRVRVIGPALPAELLDWTASADVMLMAIQPTSLNHRFTTPNKLWEAIAAGVPVVASDLPGMSQVVRETRCGELVDPTDPADIGRGIRAILDASEPDRAALLARCAAAGAVYDWEHQVDVLFELYTRLLDGS